MISRHLITHQSTVDQEDDPGFNKQDSLSHPDSCCTNRSQKKHSLQSEFLFCQTEAYQNLHTCRYTGGATTLRVVTSWVTTPAKRPALAHLLMWRFLSTNMPIKQYADFLFDSGQYGNYMSLLVNHFNKSTVERLMCRDVVSVSWDGKLYGTTTENLYLLNPSCSHHPHR